MKLIIRGVFCLLFLVVSALSGFSQSGTITTYAGNGTIGSRGDGGLATSAQIGFPAGVAVDVNRNLFTVEFDGFFFRVRKVSPGGIIFMVAEEGEFDPTGNAAVDANGNVYIADPESNFVWKVNGNVTCNTNCTGRFSNVAGVNWTAGFDGDGGKGFLAHLRRPSGVAVDAFGAVYIADSGNHRIRKLTPLGIISTIAGNGGLGSSGDGGPATSAEIGVPTGVAVDTSGTLYIADSSNHRVRRVTADGVISTVAGNGGPGFSGDDGPATSAQLKSPMDVAVDTAGNLFIVDAGNFRVRKVTPSGVIVTVVGNGTEGFAGDDGPATSAQIGSSARVAVDTSGNLFIADTGNHRIRKVDLSSSTEIVEPGSSGGDFNGDGNDDILWRDTQGNVSMWLMSGHNVAGDISIASMGPAWSIAGKGDFNGDGKTDILWRDTTGNVAIWLMNGTAISSFRAVGAISTSWTITGVADFNADGKADILWRDTAGNVAMWLMNGFTIESNAVIANIWSDWKIAGTGDFDGDGTADIVWRDTAGNVAMWLMNGTAISSFRAVAAISTSWTINTVADFNGDGKADILWRDTAGNVAMWLMNGFTIESNAVIANIWSDWKIAGTGDFNGDRKADILWRDTAGDVAIWLMDGMAVSSHSAIGNVSNRIAR